MKRLQLIFCVETNKQSDTDFRYIKEAIDMFYNYKTGNVQLNPVYLGGKGRYSTDSNKRKIDSLIKQFKSVSLESESYVLFCFDCDRFDSDPNDQKFLSTAKRFCLTKPNYRFVWFCRNVEDVFLGHQISNKQKKEEAVRFAKTSQIKKMDIERLSANQYRDHYSNLCTILDQLLIRK